MTLFIAHQSLISVSSLEEEGYLDIQDMIYQHTDKYRRRWPDI
jgi:hypothetical protein